MEIHLFQGCKENPGCGYYKGLDSEGRLLFRKDFLFATINILSFLGIVHSLSWGVKQNKRIEKIFTNSKIALNWVYQKKCETKLNPNEETESLLTIIFRAEKWLCENPILSNIQYKKELDFQKYYWPIIENNRLKNIFYGQFKEISAKIAAKRYSMPKKCNSEKEAVDWANKQILKMKIQRKSRFNYSSWCTKNINTGYWKKLKD